jgi:hypothetical protein
MAVARCQDIRERIMAKTLLASRPAPHLAVPAASVTTAPGAGKCIISSEIGTADRQAVLDLAIRRLVSRIAPGAATRSEDGMIVVSIPLRDLAAEPDARS